MAQIPRVVIAGAHSGAGKTSLTLGLVALLRKSGLKVQTFKVGPDYLDPTYLAMASGRPCYNLDGWMMGREYVERLFHRASAESDIAVIEGVMGMFDGISPASSDGSTAQIACWLDSPVLLVVNTHGMARSVAALVQGYTNFDSKVRIAGVIANRCGSQRHAEILRQSLDAALCPPMLGAVQRGSIATLSSRHLGLVSAGPRLVPPGMIEGLADAMAPALDVEKILQIARAAPPLPGADLSGEACPHQYRLGIARDEAFHFYYPDNLDALDHAGCELVDFSPLSDRQLPEDLDGIYLGGGYPEEFAAALSDNADMRAQVRHFSRMIYAECGGLMYLAEEIQTQEGSNHPQVGLLPARARMGRSRKALGYVEVTFTQSTCWGEAGDSVRGHEYHYSELVQAPDWDTAYSVEQRSAGNVFAEGYVKRRVLASYIHLHFASRPEAIQAFIR